jgi:hypothetical protein
LTTFARAPTRGEFVDGLMLLAPKVDRKLQRADNETASHIGDAVPGMAGVLSGHS